MIWEPTKVPLDDYKTWEMVSRGQTDCCFQLDKELGQSYSQKLKPNNIHEWADLISIIRPGTLDAKLGDKRLTDVYIDRKHQYDDVEYLHEDLKPILKDTQGLAIFQEESMQIATDLAGFSPADADFYIRKCISKDSIFITQLGPKSIEEIYNKQTSLKVLSVDSKGKRIWTQLTDVWKSGTKKLFRLTTTNGYSIECSHDHRFFTNHGWKELKDISEDDYVCVSTRLVYGGNNKKNTSISPKLAELFGYFLSEGCYTNKSNLKITNSDPWILGKIKANLVQLFGKKSYREYVHKNGVHDIYLKGKAQEYFCKNFQKAKSRHKKTNKLIKELNAEGCRAYIGAFISGEGYISKSSHSLNISSTSKDLLQYIQIFFLREGLHCTLYKKESKYKDNRYDSYNLSLSGTPQINLIIKLYGKYICPTKLESIKSIPIKRVNSKFLVPYNIITAISQSNNLNRLGLDNSNGGSLYSKSLSYERACYYNQYICSEFLDEVLNYDFKFVRVKSITKLNKQPVYDFSVDSNIQCAFVNGILTHNSIGKKKFDLIKKAEDKFIDGMVNNGYDKNIAIKIFDDIKKSARYAFCKSHAYTYAYDGYYFSAYPKANFTKEFFCTELTFAKGNQEISEWESIEKIILAGKAFGLKFLPPDIRYLNTDFSILGEDILYGLKKIKNISEACLKKLSTKHKGIWGYSWKRILLDVFNDLTAKQSESLIMSGAFDWLGMHRSKMLYDNSILNVIFPLTKTERQFLINFDGSCRDGLKYLLSNTDEKVIVNTANSIYVGDPHKKNEEKKVLYNKVSVEKCEKQLYYLNNPSKSTRDSLRKRAQWETNLLGLPLSLSKEDVYNLTVGSHVCKNLNDNCIPNKSEICITGVISKIRIYKSFDTKEDMCYFAIEDYSGIFKSMCCQPKTYQEYKHIIEDGDPVIITGNLSRNRYGQQKIYVNTLKEM